MSTAYPPRHPALRGFVVLSAAFLGCWALAGIVGLAAWFLLPAVTSFNGLSLLAVLAVVGLVAWSERDRTPAACDCVDCDAQRAWDEAGL